jgi:hypothetical protein
MKLTDVSTDKKRTEKCRTALFVKLYLKCEMKDNE